MKIVISTKWKGNVYIYHKINILEIILQILKHIFLSRNAENIYLNCKAFMVLYLLYTELKNYNNSFFNNILRGKCA